MHTECQELIDEVCALLGIPATLEDRAFELIAHGAHDGADDRLVDPVRARSILHRRSTAAVRAWFESFDIARASRPVRIPPEPAAGVLTGRVCVPVRHGGVVYGYIWLLDDGALALDDPRLETTAAVADRIGELLAARAREGNRLSELLRAVLTDADEGASAGAAATGLAEALAPLGHAPLTVVAVLPWDPARGAPTHATGAITHCTTTGAEGTALAALARSAAAPTVARRLRNEGADAGGGVVAGVGGPRQDVAALAGAWREALGAARVARAEPRFAGVATWEAIGPYRLLASVPTPAGGVDPAVAPLLRPEHRELRRTAEAFLDHAGRAAGTAAALGVHRQTLYYRLSRVERLTGLALDRGADRLLLHMALKAARLAEASAPDVAGAAGAGRADRASRPDDAGRTPVREPLTSSNVSGRRRSPRRGARPRERT